MMFVNILKNQLGYEIKSRSEIIEEYHKQHPRKCHCCGSEEIGITYTTGTGACGCGAGIILTSKGFVAIKKEGDPIDTCHFWFEDGKELICNECVGLGSVFCGHAGESVFL